MDNFGDIGICWRLGRQLAAEHGIAVRLWLDDQGALARLRGQDFRLSWEPDGLSVEAWDEAKRMESVGQVVIEAFACEPPAEYVERMAHQKDAPLWINLEYLSAEAWIEDCHGLPSPHPCLPLRKFFYFPGFTPASGGLIREAGLLTERDAFQGDAAAVQTWWKGLGGEDEWRGWRNMSLFSYEISDLSALLQPLADDDVPTRLLMPEGRVLPGVLGWFGRERAGPGMVLERGALRCHLLPFLPQPDYDRLLWACDLNVVRGEDSFLRAQWAARPFIWHVYPQDEEAHLVKLEAFLGRYLTGADLPLAAAVAALQRAWNRDQALGEPWTAALACLPGWAVHARVWAAGLAEQTDLAQRLVRFAKSKI